MIEKLLDRMRRAGIDVDTIERVTNIGEKHCGGGLFPTHYRVTFDDRRVQIWYQRIGRAFKVRDQT